MTKIIKNLALVSFMLIISNPAIASYPVSDEIPENLINQNNILQIWTVDCRPDSNVVILSWIGPQSNTKIACRIQKWEIKDNPINLRVINVSLKPEQGKYEYYDKELIKGVDYRYKVWMILGNEYLISQEVFTARPPSIVKWGDYPSNPNFGDIVYENGINYIAVVKNRHFENPIKWHADSLKLRITIKDSVKESEWIASDTVAFDPKMDKSSLSDGDTCYYYIRAKDSLGNVSRWSEMKEAILDISKPDQEVDLTINPIFIADSTDGYMQILWPPISDEFSGLSHYYLWHKVGINGEFQRIQRAEQQSLDMIAVNVDTFSIINTSKRIYYKIEAIDNVGNKGFIAEDSIRCLIGPNITVSNDTTFENSVEVFWDGYDMTGIDCFELRTNGFKVRVPNNAISTKAFLPDSGINIIQVRAVLLDINNNDSLFSIWSNTVQVVKGFFTRVLSVSVEHDVDFSKMHEGNLKVSWLLYKPSNCKLHIYRQELGEKESVCVAVISSDSLSWIDYYDSCKWDPNIDQDRPLLKSFQKYIYFVYPLNPINGLLAIGASDTNYCNKAPEIKRLKFIPDPEGKVINNKLSTIWKLPSQSTYELSSTGFDLQLFTNYCPQSIKEIEEGTNKINVPKDTMFTWRGISKGSRQYLFVRSIAMSGNDKFFSAWSKVMSCKTRDIKLIDKAKIAIQDQPGKGLYLNWSKYQDEFVDRYRIVIDYKIVDAPVTRDTFFMHFPAQLMAPIQYTYIIQPGVIDSSDRKNPTTIFYDEIANDKIIAENDPGRVYIPRIDLSIYPMNQYCGGNSLKVKWYWVDNKGSIIQDPNNFRGATAIEVKLSNNNGEFIKSPIINLDSKNLNMNNYEYTFQDWNKNLNVPHCCCLNLQIIAYDYWGHSGCTKDFDGDILLTRDCQPPDEIKILNFESWASETSEKYLIDVVLHWQRPPDLCKTNSYSILIDSLYNDNYQQIDKLDFNVGQSDNNGKRGYKLKDSIYVHSLTNADRDTIILKYRKTRRSDNTFLNDNRYSYRIESYDVFGNKQPASNNAQNYFKFICAPETLWVTEENDSTIVNWSKVALADSYYLEYVDNEKMLGSFFIRFRQNCCITANTRLAILNSKLSDTTYFHVLAIDSIRIFQSSWSNVVSVIKENQIKKDLLSDVMNTQIIPNKFSLCQSYPNPFNSEMIIPFEVPKSSPITIKIFNTLGDELITFPTRTYEPGFHHIIWDGKDKFGDDVTSGVYFYMIIAKDFKDVKKCLKIK